jgi:hypothetical protein
MSDCIYHDAPSVAVCPACEFPVCQECIDGGENGVCAECTTERKERQANSVLVRDFLPAAPIAPVVSAARCGYCRVLEDEETPLNEEGFCESCAILPRCVNHIDLVAVDKCKVCRQPHCRKCLGFTNICPSCTEKGKVASESAAKITKPKSPPVNANANGKKTSDLKNKPAKSPTKPISAPKPPEASTSKKTKNLNTPAPTDKSTKKAKTDTLKSSPNKKKQEKKSPARKKKVDSSLMSTFMNFLSRLRSS